jgi:predicted  nucleic acid-binding Zn-ribbon protein
MITNKNLLAAVAIVVCCITVIWFSTTTQGSPKTYEVRPRISLPEYKTDTVHAIDAYEKLMERYMSMTERNSIRIDSDLKEVIKRLDSINYKLTELSLRIANIEKTFGIEESKPQAKKKPRAKVPDNKIPKEPLPIW